MTGSGQNSVALINHPKSQRSKGETSFMQISAGAARKVDMWTTSQSEVPAVFPPSSPVQLLSTPRQNSRKTTTAQLFFIGPKGLILSIKTSEALASGWLLLNESCSPEREEL